MTKLSYRIALKYPGGVQYRHYQKHVPTPSLWKNGNDVNDWIHAQLFDDGAKVITHYLLWNDQPPPGTTASTKCGHTKGILMVHSTGIRLLIHSIPKFPERFRPLDRMISRVSEEEQIFGQSLICIHLDQLSPATLRLETNKLTSQIMYMNPNIIQTSPGMAEHEAYSSQTHLREHSFLPNSIFWPCVSSCVASCVTSCVSSCVAPLPVVLHVAKPSLSRENRYCLFDRLAEIYGGPCRVQSWGRPQSLPTKDVSHVSDIRMSIDSGLKGTKGTKEKETGTKEKETKGTEKETHYRTTQDHSKWAVSEEPAEISKRTWTRWTPKTNRLHWVFIGDMNRMTSQHARGGGGIMIVGDLQLWKAFHELCASVVREC